MDEVKPWRCKNGHVLGLVVKNEADVSELLLYRHAVDKGADSPVEVDVMLGPVVGNMTVRCDLCEDCRTWHVDVDEMLYLVECMEFGDLFRFWNKLLQKAKKFK